MTARRTWSAFAILLLSACGPGRVAWQPRTVSGEGALVVLGTTAPIRTRPDVRAPLVPLSAASPLTRFGEALHSFRLLRSRGGWAELETLGPDAGTCAAPPSMLTPFRLLIYVREESLRPVTRMEVERRFPDGTSAFLARGVPVERVRGQTHRVHFGRLAFPLTLRPENIGTRYLPSHFVPREPMGQLDPETLAASAVGLGGQRVEAPPETLLPVHGVEPAGLRENVTVHSSCGTLTLQAPEGRVEERSLLLGVASEEPVAWVRAGADARWPDGRAAGDVREDTGLGAARDEAGCFGLLGWDDVTLCFDPSDISDAPPPERGLAGALSTP
ncbi:MAG: hypothetical protein AB8I08_08385 [Sandaracinaceae bacterium]